MHKKVYGKKAPKMLPQIINLDDDGNVIEGEVTEVIRDIMI